MFEKIKNALKKNKEVAEEQNQDAEKVVVIKAVKAGDGSTAYRLPFSIEVPESAVKTLNTEKIMLLQLQELRKYIIKQTSEMNKLKCKVGILSKQLSVLKAAIKGSLTDDDSK